MAHYCHLLGLALLYTGAGESEAMAAMADILRAVALLCFLTAPTAGQPPGDDCIPPAEAEMSPMVTPDG